MSLKNKLMEVGYFPENLPPFFSSYSIARFFNSESPNTFLSNSHTPLRSASYNASKRGMTRRNFSVIHPSTAYDLSEFISSRWSDLKIFMAQSPFSFSEPKEIEGADRAVEITSHSELERIKYGKLCKYRFIAQTDISRFYHSIYTHSLPWAVHGKEVAKANRKANSSVAFMNRLDRIFQIGQDGQTMGIPVGPDGSRIAAELVSVAIDIIFAKEVSLDRITIIRHVDDVWIGGNSIEDVEKSLWRYREAIRSFELDINESKTKIYSSNFSFADHWPSALTEKLDFSLSSPTKQKQERLRAALEFAFRYSIDNGDDGVLKFVINYLDKSEHKLLNWSTIEPFLKRVAIHSGHCIDYIVRIIVWRHTIFEDLDIKSWEIIIMDILNRHAKLGNDSEVCWALYACSKLGIFIREDLSKNIVEGCGALSIVALVNNIKETSHFQNILHYIRDIVKMGDDNGTYWPVFLEWRSGRWPLHTTIPSNNPIISTLVRQNVTIYDSSADLVVFRGVQQDSIKTVRQAIEVRSGYDDNDNIVETSNDDDINDDLRDNIEDYL